MVPERRTWEASKHVFHYPPCSSSRDSLLFERLPAWSVVFDIANKALKFTGPLHAMSGAVPVGSGR